MKVVNPFYKTKVWIRKRGLEGRSGTSKADIRKTFKVGTGTIYRLLEREGIKR
ncbi:hypothetical protein [Lederbergia citri]|uniref:Uncharacterized protein n=1 Tax=Lederbergia citri TaxID=2833580 RepID=A0A942TBF2_9BACI|nr:hypothetical protein [Lederbergia citri]MBS4194670.1 hypothetical protein [Lederbergia citri]